MLYCLTFIFAFPSDLFNFIFNSVKCFLVGFVLLNSAYTVLYFCLYTFLLLCVLNFSYKSLNGRKTALSREGSDYLLYIYDINLLYINFPVAELCWFVWANEQVAVSVSMVYKFSAYSICFLITFGTE